MSELVNTTCIINALARKSVSLVPCALEERIIISSLGEARLTAKGGRGCPQGEVLSPLRGSDLVDELIKRLISARFYCLGYADDLVIFVRHKFAGILSEHLQIALNIIDKWGMEEEVTVKPHKTTLSTLQKGKY